MIHPKLYQGIFTGVFLGYILAAGTSWRHIGAALIAATAVLAGWLLCDLALIGLRLVRRSREGTDVR